MAKRTYRYVCGSCGFESGKWLGRCPSCSTWNSFQEEPILTSKTKTVTRRSRGDTPAGPVALGDIGGEESFRFSCNISELDSVLGGGIVRGSSVLVGGEPGIGKSTLMLQLLASMPDEKSLYVSGEESARQIRNRAQRIKLAAAPVNILCETRLETVIKTLRDLKPNAVVIDSIQTLVCDEIGAVPGTVNQLKYSCLELIDWAKESQGAVFLVGHVTKDGSIAGPKVIEHMVDTVLYFEQGQTGIRLLRAAKNRFGSVDEIGIFMMESQGLVPAADPGSFFLVQRNGALPAGITSAVVFEGTRSYFVEIQALTVNAKSGYSRVYSEKIDTSRVSRIAAVMEKHLGMSFSDQDIYVNVAGGIRLDEVGMELPLALALYSARSGKPLPAKTVSAGELSLAGEIRPIPHMDRRVKTAFDMGFTSFIGPSYPRITRGAYSGCATIAEAVRNTYGTSS